MMDKFQGEFWLMVSQIRVMDKDILPEVGKKAVGNIVIMDKDSDCRESQTMNIKIL